MADLAQGQSGAWWIIWATATGAAVSEQGDPPDAIALTAQGLSSTQLDHRPDPIVEQWDPVAHTVIPRTAASTPRLAPPSNSSYKFTSYVVLDNPAGVEATFFGPLPGGRLDFVTVIFLDTELAAVTTQAQMATLARNKLGRKLRATGIAAQLDNLIGQSLTV